MRRFTLPAVGVLGVAALALTGCQSTAGEAAAADPNAPITIATIPVGEDPTAENPVEVFAELLEAATGRDVEITDVPDYLSVVEAIRADHVDIGIMSGFPSALAVNTGEVDALVAFQGDDAPVSTCVVLDDSPIQEVEDLAGKTVAFADQASSSGYFMPVYMLHEAGLERDADYEAIFAGGHEGSFAALAQGQVDAACTAVMLTQLGKPMFPFEDGEWRAVGESPAMPIAGAVLGRQSLDAETRKVIQDGIAEVFSPENAERLGAYGSFAAAPQTVDPKAEEFAGFAEIAAVAGVELKDLK
ncbi:phosphate/phosphite/phosphonate ABC transporter substrate-binding protein [Agromyces mediolanus]|uniref:Phosphonates-binding protein n=1 Tax=Agromyces mediolanus TaxID=41986 RepID=A0A918FCT6_AGRME|nr:phosphate/phosphite/phosphonate ABC transporter substrate-binding protein [Agromyces mediolanus]MCD1569916.1 phosphate/phosphite/phosphonate ABC transporter substrate-binding protein [Agromyces mediolanus]GGR23144.1 phosphonates-binding protein [Agromyces mediolanus]GLJ71126.1 phosphonates-binding protein [Agromyces mediolanus]